MNSGEYVLSMLAMTDFLIVGSGVAGLSTAIKASRAGRVVIISKSTLSDGNTERAQGGIAAAIGADDSPSDHLSDTLRAGHQLVDPLSAQILVEGGPETIRELIGLGARFDVDNAGNISLGREGAHGKNRIVHARGDATGAEIVDVLSRAVFANKKISVLERHFALDLIISNEDARNSNSDRKCTGVAVIDPHGKLRIILARAIVIATGGCGRLYKYTTNSKVATGDGMALAARHGVKVVDMEFVQFHPTALTGSDDPMILISEAVRGEGAVLIDEAGQPFMRDEHPERDLAPRDVVARSIFRRMAEGHHVYLDTRSIGQRFKDRFPSIYRACRERQLDPAKQPIPVSPAAHFMMGGIKTDTLGRTSLPGLYACGEAACTGVHGANRLASNSLLEGLVYADRVAKSISNTHPHEFKPPSDAYVRHIAGKFGLNRDAHVSQTSPNRDDPNVVWRGVDQTAEHAHLMDALRTVMWDAVGIVRNKDSLLNALKVINDIQRQAPNDAWTLRNMIKTAKLITQSALQREESRGGHYREDFPGENDSWQEKRITL